MGRSPLPSHSKTQSSPRQRHASTARKSLLVRIRYKPPKPASLLVKLRYKPLPSTLKIQKPVLPRKIDASIDPKILLSKIRDKLDYEKRHGITAEEPWRRVRYHLEQLDRKDSSYVRNARVRRKKAKEVYRLWLAEQPHQSRVEVREKGGSDGESESEDRWSECDVDKLWEDDPDRICPWQ